jgi:hypothetical protein
MYINNKIVLFWVGQTGCFFNTTFDPYPWSQKNMKNFLSALFYPLLIYMKSKNYMGINYYDVKGLKIDQKKSKKSETL